MSPEVSVHLLMDRIEALDSEVGLSCGWFFLMTHGHWVDSDIGMAIAQGLKAQRIRLPDPDARAAALGGSKLRLLMAPSMDDLR